MKERVTYLWPLLPQQNLLGSDRATLSKIVLFLPCSLEDIAIFCALMLGWRVASSLKRKVVPADGDVASAVAAWQNGCLVDIMHAASGCGEATWDGSGKDG